MRFQILDFFTNSESINEYINKLFFNASVNLLETYLIDFLTISINQHNHLVNELIILLI